MSGLGFNDRYEQLKLKRGTLREQCATLIEMLAHLVNVVAPEIKARYMVEVGQLEHHVYELKTEIRRWQRRFALRQAALNRGETPNLVTIEATLDMEFASYMETIRKNLDEIKAAFLHVNSERLTREESEALRLAYHEAAKKLHPDLNTNLSKSAKDLWLQIQEAYERHDWEKVSFLASLVDGVVSGDENFVGEETVIAKLEAAVADLEGKCAEIQRRIAEAKSIAPLCYESFLADRHKVAERQAQLDAQIKALGDYVKEYEELWKHGK